MKRKTGNKNRFSGYYRYDLLEYCRMSMGLTIPEVSKQSGVKLDSTRRVFTGEAHQKQVWPIAHFFNVDWKMLHDLTLDPSEFHRVVLAGEPSSVR